MAYANSLPPIIIKVCRWFNTACLALTLLVCLDVLVLPRAVHKEKIISKGSGYRTALNRRTGATSPVPAENVVLVTENFRYEYLRTQGFAPAEADSATLITTPLLKIIDTVHIILPHKEKELKQHVGLLGSYMFLAIAFGLIALFGVAMRHNKEQLLNAAVTNILVLLLLMLAL